VGYDEYRQIKLSYDVCHCERFAAAGYAHKGLEFGTRAQTFCEPVYSIRLVTGRLILVIELELCHFFIILSAD
jgi:hypothetical protein